MAKGFEVANVVVALNGDIMNTVPKKHVTAGEIAVLQAIHGGDAVTEIQIVGRAGHSLRAERARLEARYGKAVDGNQRRYLDQLFPGAAARIFEDIEELHLVTAQFKPGHAPQVFIDAELQQANALAEAAKGIMIADAPITLVEGTSEGSQEGFPEVEGDDPPFDDDEAEPTPRNVPDAVKPKPKRSQKADAELVLS